MNTKLISIKRELENNNINKKSYPNALCIDKKSLQNMPISYYECKWYGLYNEKKLVSVAQISERKDNKEIFVKALETNIKQRKKGYAPKILSDIIEIYKKDGYKQIGLIPMNRELIPFYIKLGFNTQENCKKMVKKIN